MKSLRPLSRIRRLRNQHLLRLLLLLAAWAAPPLAASQTSGMPAQALRLILPESPDGRFIRGCMLSTSRPADTVPAAVVLDVTMARSIAWLHLRGEDMSLDATARESLSALVRSWSGVLGEMPLRIAAWAGRGSQGKAYATVLSERAAQAVAHALVEAGASAQRIETIGLGAQVELTLPEHAGAGEVDFVIAVALDTARSEPAATPRARASPGVELVRKLYQTYAFEAAPIDMPLQGVEAATMARLQEFFERPLAQALRQDHACSLRRGVPCELEEKILWASQDPRVCHAFAQHKPGEVVVSLIDAAGRTQTLRFHITRGAQEARISDIVSEFTSLKQRFRGSRWR